MKQFLDLNKPYLVGETVVYVGSRFNDEHMAEEMYPVLKPGSRYTIENIYERGGFVWLKLVGIMEANDHDDNYEIDLNQFFFMETEQDDYELAKQNPERMKEFIKTALQFIMNNHSMYMSVKTNMKFLENKKELENSLLTTA